MTDTVDQEVIQIITDKFSSTLEVLELMGCKQIDDIAIIRLSSNLVYRTRGTNKKKSSTNKTNESSINKIKYLNLSCLPKIRDASIKSIQDNLLNGIQAINIWGCVNLSADCLFTFFKTKLKK